MKRPLVSIIIPCFNHGKFIEAAIASVKQQPYQNVEIIVVDDGSTDSYTVEVLNKISNDVKVIRQSNSGPSVARNNAIRQSNGEYILALDSDNKIRPQYISKAVEILKTKPEVGVVYGDFQYYGSKSDIKEQPEFNIKQQLLYNLFDMCAVFRRKVFDDVGGFDEFMSKPGLEDWDFWISVWERNWKFVHVPEVMFDYYVAETSRTFQVANKNLEMLREYVWRKHAKLLANEYEQLYHEHKNMRGCIDYRIGSILLYPFRIVKKCMRR
jgi:glycosyltransferase involved in cell wall biosynthesis